MTIVSLTDSCRQLGIDPKTLRRWLASAPFSVHPPDGHRHGLTQEQLCWLASAHHRSLPVLLGEPSQPAPSTEPLPVPDDLLEVVVALRALPSQLAALQEQVADLTHQLSHQASPTTTARSRSGATAKATNSHRGGRGRTTSRQPQRPSKAQVLALVEYAGEGHYVVISPRGGLLPFEPESPAWFAWLTTCSSFRFVGSLGRLTAHRELYNVTRAVWRAHRKIRNHSYSVHLGKMEDLTITVLEQAAAALHAHL